MSLFTVLFSPKASELPSKQPSGKKELVYLMGVGKFDVEIIHEERYQAALEAISGPCKPQGVNCYETASLILEDKAAVRVEIQRRQVGYLSTEAASFLRQQLIARGMPHGVGQCAAVIRGGWVSSNGRQGPYKVWIDFPKMS